MKELRKYISFDSVVQMDKTIDLTIKYSLICIIAPISFRYSDTSFLQPQMHFKYL